MKEETATTITITTPKRAHIFFLLRRGFSFVVKSLPLLVDLLDEEPALTSQSPLWSSLPLLEDPRQLQSMQAEQRQRRKVFPADILLQLPVSLGRREIFDLS